LKVAQGRALYFHRAARVSTYLYTQVKEELSPRKKRATFCEKETKSNSRFCAGPGANFEKKTLHPKVIHQAPHKIS